MVSAYLTYAYACNASNFLPKYDPSRTAANSSTEEVLIETGFIPSIFTPGTASALTDRTVFLNLSRFINSSTRITWPKIFVAANSFMPEGVKFAAVFPTTPPAFKTTASIGSFISSTAFLTEFASVTSPIIISKIFSPFSPQGLSLLPVLSLDFCKKELPFWFLFSMLTVGQSLSQAQHLLRLLKYFRSFFLRLRGKGLRSSREAPRGQSQLAIIELFGYIMVRWSWSRSL